MTLKAIRPVLYRSKQYRAGDTLPADHEATVTAWLEAGSAVWLDEDDTPAAAPKAKPAAAPAGIPGKSGDRYNGELIGKVPATPERQKGKPVRRKKAGGAE